jgi:hypothetical protein
MFRGVVRHSTVDVNSTGITLFSGGSAFHNVVSRNLSVGLNLSTNSGYLGNTLLDNSPNVSAGRNLGQNLCDTAVCP